MNKKTDYENLNEENPSIPKDLFTEEFAEDFIKHPKCLTCGKPMVNVVDSITKKISPYLWKTTCGHGKNLIMSIG